MIDPSVVIETAGLRKVYGTRVAVQDLTLQVARGEIFGFLGPNGAGKSTSVKMLLGLVRPTAGDARVLGRPLSNVDVRRLIGFLPEEFRFYDWLSAVELVRFHGRLCGMTAERLRTRVPEVLGRVGLADHASQRVRGFSKGMMQRVGLAQAIVHEPEVLFLDEPTSGLDPMGRRMVRDVLRAERERGATVFLNSHFLSEVEVTCDRVAFLKDGAVVMTKDLRTHQNDAIRVVVHAKDVGPLAMSGLEQWAQNVDYGGGELTFTVSSQDQLPDVLRHLVTSGAAVSRFTAEEVSLEDAFVRIMGRDAGL
ncbi:MAG TPA: ABC transporter ATP-binding protein [Gemmatimonadales bacterium]|nr:ABC transporter ATP-binding protein [Gemmatimonadales bacterium]